LIDINMIIGIVSLVFLLGLVVYLLMLIINSSRITSISQSTAELEAKVLEARIKLKTSHLFTLLLMMETNYQVLCRDSI
jgi:hypothetical protein